jgi:hypothetical protein
MLAGLEPFIRSGPHPEPGKHRVTATRITIMPAIGCMIPLVVLIVGAAIGGAIGGTTFAVWGGLAGFVIGLLGALAALRAFERARDNLPE